jgi:hypothetical protein
VKKLLARLEMRIGQMDVIELNEASAAQGVAVLRGLGLPDDAPHVNPNGGAIAIGHPLGARGYLLPRCINYNAPAEDMNYALCALGLGRALPWR